MITDEDINAIADEWDGHDYGETFYTEEFARAIYNRCADDCAAALDEKLAVPGIPKSGCGDICRSLKHPEEGKA